ncbi:MAG: hypothetical protein P8J37_13465 [Fuerstiella sp.]|nr:hypothetical protein [Fuerstiella sp.]
MSEYPDKLWCDSFTWSAGVEDDAAWPEILSSSIDARVDNFGEGGYGSDQALLRFHENCRRGTETAPVVILMHLTENILRNVNQYRDLLYPGNGCGFKPRFIVRSDGELKQLPLPKISVEEYERFVANPENFLTHETFMPGGPSGPVRPRFPYTLTVLRAVSHFHVVAKIRREPRHKSFYQSDHAANGLSVTAGILQEFHRLAEARGQKSLVVLLPTRGDFEYHKRTGDWTYSNLVCALTTRGIPLLDLGPDMHEKMGNGHLSDFYGDVNPHHNERGYRMIADLVSDRLSVSESGQARKSILNRAETGDGVGPLRHD